jgi:aspartate aminotransferase-like enzyme
MILGEGLQNVFALRARSASVRAGARALGLALVAPERRARGDGVFTPAGIDSGALQKYLIYLLGVEFVGGQDQFNDKILRLAYLVFIDTFDILTCIAALEFALAKFGHDVQFGRGVGAAQAILATGLPATAARS